MQTGDNEVEKEGYSYNQIDRKPSTQSMQVISPSGQQEIELETVAATPEFRSPDRIIENDQDGDLQSLSDNNAWWDIDSPEQNRLNILKLKDQ